MTVTDRPRAARLQLTRRELGILRLVAHGFDSPDIAAKLHVSESTVKTIRSLAYRKLGARSAAHAVGIAYRLGVLDDGLQRDIEMARLARELGCRIALVRQGGFGHRVVAGHESGAGR